MRRALPALALLAACGCGAAPESPFRRTFRTSEEAMEAMREREPSAPWEGQEAPDFELARVDGGGRLRLSSFRGKAPVVLLFGSYT